MRLTNTDKLPLSIAVWLATDNYDHNRYPGEFHMSATGLLRPVRQAILGQRARETAERVPMDIKDLIPSAMGSAIHSSIEKAWVYGRDVAMQALGYSKDIADKIRINPEEVIKGTIPIYVEKRFAKKIATTNVRACIIDGCPDFIGDGTLEDFKSTGVFSYLKGGNDDNYIKQGSIYRWLVPEIITSDFIRINQIFTDWSKLDSIIKKDRGYPHSRIISKKLPLMSYEETDQFIKQRIEELYRFSTMPETELPYCTDEELWRDAPAYKFYTKVDSKRATKVCDTYAEAHAVFMERGATGIIKEFPGRVKRCAYCDGKTLCTQKNQYIEEGLLTL